MCDISLKEAYYSEVLRALSSIPQERVKNPLNSLHEKLHWRMNVDKKMVLFGLCTVSSFSFLEWGACPFYSLLDRGYIIPGSWGQCFSKVLVIFWARKVALCVLCLHSRSKF